jgi:hypothetical protein
MQRYLTGEVSLDCLNQGMTIEGPHDNDTYDLSWFHVDGHDCDGTPSHYPIDLIEGVDVLQLWVDNGGTGLCYATCTEAQAQAIVDRLRILGAVDGVPAEV